MMTKPEIRETREAQCPTALGLIFLLIPWFAIPAWIVLRFARADQGFAGFEILLLAPASAIPAIISAYSAASTLTTQQHHVPARLKLWLPANMMMLTLNLTDASYYLWWASKTWAIPAEKAAGIQPTAADGFIWGLVVLQTFTIGLLMNVPWGIMILLRRKWSSGCFWLLAASIWIVAICIDFAPQHRY